MTSARHLFSLSSVTAGLLGVVHNSAADNSAADRHLNGVQSLGLLLQAFIAVVIAFVASVVVHVVVKRIGRRSVVAADVARRAKTPFRVFLVVLAVQQVAERSVGNDTWLDIVRIVLRLGLVAAIAWLVAVALFVAEDVVLAHYRVDTEDNGHARRVQTQVTIVRRVLVGAILVLTVAGMLLTFPQARQVGAGIFASAGLLSVVAGLAAQTTLANVFAGLQLAFTDALRVDDVVVVQEEWGKIEELTLTYVVVHIWDDRRLVLPSTYFTSTPFENWTRRDSQLLGTVMLEVDWTTDFEGMRTELARVVEADDLWDRRTSVLQVTDAVGSYVQVRILVSAQDGPSAFDLRCHVREAMVRWLVASNPGGLPRLRVRSDAEALTHEGGVAAGQVAPIAAATPSPRTPARTPARTPPPARVEPATPATVLLPALPSRHDSLFTGSFDALERSRKFSGPSEAEQASRERAIRESESHGAQASGGNDDDTSTRVLPVVPEPKR